MSFIGALRLIRPVNCILTFSAVWMGAIISVDHYFSGGIILASISAGFLAGYGYAVNDLFDYDTDMIYKTARPLVSGEMDKKRAIFISAALAIAGIIMASFINKFALVFAAFTVVALTLYTPAFKGRGFAGNILISIVSSSAFIYGGLATKITLNTIIISMFALFTHFAREIIKDIQDLDSDKLSNIKTGVVLYGEGTARILARITLATLAFLIIIPYILGYYKLAYFIFILAGIEPFLMYSIFKFRKSVNPATAGRVSAILKIIMPIGILAVFAGSRGF